MISRRCRGPCRLHYFPTHAFRDACPTNPSHELQEVYDGECGAPEENVYQRSGQEGMPPKRTKHEIQKLRDKGEIYSPDQDHLRLV